MHTLLVFRPGPLPIDTSGDDLPVSGMALTPGSGMIVASEQTEQNLPQADPGAPFGRSSVREEHFSQGGCLDQGVAFLNGATEPTLLKVVIASGAMWRREGAVGSFETLCLG